MFHTWDSRINKATAQGDGNKEWCARCRTVTFLHGQLCQRTGTTVLTLVYICGLLEHFHPLNDPFRSQRIVGPSESLTERCDFKGRCVSNTKRLGATTKTRKAPNKSPKRAKGTSKTSLPITAARTFGKHCFHTVGGCSSIQRSFPGKEFGQF